MAREREGGLTTQMGLLSIPGLPQRDRVCLRERETERARASASASARAKARGRKMSFSREFRHHAPLFSKNGTSTRPHERQRERERTEKREEEKRASEREHDSAHERKRENAREKLFAKFGQINSSTLYSYKCSQQCTKPTLLTKYSGQGPCRHLNLIAHITSTTYGIPVVACASVKRDLLVWQKRPKYRYVAQEA